MIKLARTPYQLRLSNCLKRRQGEGLGVWKIIAFPDEVPCASVRTHFVVRPNWYFNQASNLSRTVLRAFKSDSIWSELCLPNAVFANSVPCEVEERLAKESSGSSEESSSLANLKFRSNSQKRFSSAALTLFNLLSKRLQITAIRLHALEVTRFRLSQL